MCNLRATCLLAHHRGLVVNSSVLESNWPPRPPDILNWYHCQECSGRFQGPPPRYGSPLVCPLCVPKPKGCWECKGLEGAHEPQCRQVEGLERIVTGLLRPRPRRSSSLLEVSLQAVRRRPQAFPTTSPRVLLLFASSGALTRLADCSAGRSVATPVVLGLRDCPSRGSMAASYTSVFGSREARNTPGVDRGVCPLRDQPPARCPAKLPFARTLFRHSPSPTGGLFNPGSFPSRGCFLATEKEPRKTPCPGRAEDAGQTD